MREAGEWGGWPALRREACLTWCCNARSPPKDTYIVHTHHTHNEQRRLNHKAPAVHQTSVHKNVDGWVYVSSLPRPAARAQSVPGTDRPTASARPSAHQDDTTRTGGGGSVAAAAAVPDRPARYTRCNW